MGFEISIIQVVKSNKTATLYDVTTLDRDYLSFNWSISTEDRDTWYMGDYDGESSTIVRSSLVRALKELSERGIYPGEPDLSNPGWSYGTDSCDDSFLPDSECLSIFAFHLHRFLELTDKYPDAYWATDSNETMRINHAEYGLIDLDPLHSDNVNENNNKNDAPED
jgi:hypothetical protein